MIENSRLAAISGLALVLAGCVGNAIPRATPPRAAAAAMPITAPRPTQNNSLIGRPANTALGLFGRPRLDVAEGAARKLQFGGTTCILDVYYYASRQGADALATHVDARTPDGRDANVPSCIDALRK